MRTEKSNRIKQYKANKFAQRLRAVVYTTIHNLKMLTHNTINEYMNERVCSLAICISMNRNGMRMEKKRKI